MDVESIVLGCLDNGTKDYIEILLELDHRTNRELPFQELALTLENLIESGLVVLVNPVGPTYRQATARELVANLQE